MSASIPDASAADAIPRIGIAAPKRDGEHERRQAQDSTRQLGAAALPSITARKREGDRLDTYDYGDPSHLILSYGETVAVLERLSEVTVSFTQVGAYLSLLSTTVRIMAAHCTSLKPQDVEAVIAELDSRAATAQLACNIITELIETLSDRNDDKFESELNEILKELENKPCKI